MNSQPAIRDDTAPAETSRSRRAPHDAARAGTGHYGGAPHDTVHIDVPPSPPDLAPAAARALLEILLAAAQSAPSVTPQRDNHPDVPQP
jgi:hypothetical protein